VMGETYRQCGLEFVTWTYGHARHYIDLGHWTAVEKVGQYDDWV